MKCSLCALFAVVLLAGCKRGPPPDLQMGNHLLAVLYGEQPTIHGDALTRLSAEMPQYQRLLMERSPEPLSKEFLLRDSLAWHYTLWCYDDEALALLRDGLKTGQLGPGGGPRLALQAAFARDVSTLEKAWKSAANDGAVIGNTALEHLARGEVAAGLVQGLNDLNRQPDVSVRSSYRTYLARIMAQDALNPKPGGLEERIFYVQLHEFLHGGDWSDFVRRFSNDEHDILQTVLVQNLILTMGSAAEYYAKLGNEPQKAEWLQRLADVSGAYRKKNHPREADWSDYLIARAKNMPARTPTKRVL